MTPPWILRAVLYAWSQGATLQDWELAIVHRYQRDRDMQLAPIERHAAAQGRTFHHFRVLPGNAA